MRTGTRGGRRTAAGGWVLAALVWAAGCGGNRGAGATGAGGARPASGAAASAKGAAEDTTALGKAAKAAKAAEARRRGRRTDGFATGGEDDSVQVGYGTMNRRRMTGSVSSVSGDVVRSQPSARIEELLQRVPGLQVLSRSDGSFSVIVRGRTTLGSGSPEPLFVIDGVPVEDGPATLRGIAPEDVARIDVVKDAEASIYGSRSANGVIIVRTRQGGRKP